jgi:hypothetical protein
MRTAVENGIEKEDLGSGGKTYTDKTCSLSPQRSALRYS